MKNLIITEKKPLRGILTRLTENFEQTNPTKAQFNNTIIKNYVYVDEKRVIA